MKDTVLMHGSHSFLLVSLFIKLILSVDELDSRFWRQMVQRLLQICRFSQLMGWRQQHLLCPSRNQFRRVCSKSPPTSHPPLPQKAIMVSEIRGSTPLEMSTSRPSLCCRLLQNESVQFSCTMETAGLCLWPICFPSLLRSAWLN